MTIADAIAWIKKYLIAASLLFLLFSILIIIGIKDIRLISNPIHIPNKVEDEIVIKVPEMRKNEYTKGGKYKFIKKKCITIVGVWTQKLKFSLSFLNKNKSILYDLLYQSNPFLRHLVYKKLKSLGLVYVILSKLVDKYS